MAQSSNPRMNLTIRLILVALVLALVAFFFFARASGPGHPPRLLGKWMESGGKNMYYDLRADGTFERNYIEPSYPFTHPVRVVWNGTWTSDGQTLFLSVTSMESNAKGTDEREFKRMKSEIVGNLVRVRVNWTKPGEWTSYGGSYQKQP